MIARRVLAAVGVIVLILGLRMYADREPHPLNGTEKITFRYGPRSGLEVTVLGGQARDLVAGAREHEGLGNCACEGVSPAVLVAGGKTYPARVCRHALTVEDDDRIRYFRMQDTFSTRHAAFCDSLLVPVAGATTLKYEPEHQSAAARATVLVQAQFARLGAPTSIASQDGRIFHIRFRELKPSVVGGYLYRVDVAAGTVKGQPRF